MPGLSDQVNILVASHATLYTLLQEIHDVKKGERERRRPTRYVESYRPTSKTPPPATPLALPQREPLIEEVLKKQRMPLHKTCWKLRGKSGRATKFQTGLIIKLSNGN